VSRLPSISQTISRCVLWNYVGALREKQEQSVGSVRSPRPRCHSPQSGPEWDGQGPASYGTLLTASFRTRGSPRGGVTARHQGCPWIFDKSPGRGGGRRYQAGRKEAGRAVKRISSSSATLTTDDVKIKKRSTNVPVGQDILPVR